MKKISLFIALGLMAMACSNDDDPTPLATCNCEKLIQEYDEASQHFEIVEVIPFGNDCSTDTQGQRGTEGEHYYSIECEQIQ